MQKTRDPKAVPITDTLNYHREIDKIHLNPMIHSGIMTLLSLLLFRLIILKSHYCEIVVSVDFVKSDSTLD